MFAADMRAMEVLFLGAAQTRSWAREQLRFIATEIATEPYGTGRERNGWRTLGNSKGTDKSGRSGMLGDGPRRRS